MNTDPIDPTEYQLPQHAVDKGFASSKSGKPKVKTRKALSGPFLKGPVCMEWLVAAAKCGGKSLECAIAIQYLCGLKKSATIRLSRKVVEEFGVSRTSGYRALEELEHAGLIKVERAQGRLPVVTYLALQEPARETQLL